MSTVELDSLDDLPNVFLDLEEEFRSTSYEQPLETFAGDLRDAHGRMFDEERTPTGRDWAPWRWRPDWASDYKPTLFVTGRLRSSLESEGSPDHIERVEPLSLEFGSSVPYSPLHNEGGQIRTGIPLVGRDGAGYLPAGTLINIPQREHVGMNAAQVDQLAELAADHAVTVLRG